MNIYQLQQHIENPTRVTPTTSSLIDVIFTYVGDNKTLETGVIPLGISDHNLVYICRKISFPGELPKFVLTRQYKRYNVNAFNHDLNEIFNLYSPVSNDPNELWGDFKLKFLSIAGKHAPVKQRRVKREFKPWITSEIKHLIYHRDYLKRQAIRLRSVYYETAYKKCKNKITNLIRTSKENYFKAKLSDSKNSKESWQFINELLNKNSKTSQIREINFDGKTVTKDEEIAAGFNEYFSTIGSMLFKAIKDCDTDPLSFLTVTHDNIFNFNFITIDEVISALNLLPPKKSSGLDGISAKLLKDAAHNIAGPLVDIFNLSLRTGIFPDDWKLAKVTPVFKDGNRNICGNYRPISVISVVAKVFEKLVYQQLKSFMIKNNILMDLQSGFRAKHSTETTLLSSTNEWLCNMDKGLFTGVLFLDLEKAFDTVDHSILLAKLEKYGIQGCSLEWFKSYLKGRKQVCSIYGKKSSVKDINYGAPQGSNLGPILFLLYINDLPNSLKMSKPSMFADDTNLACIGRNSNEIEIKLNEELENVQRWLTANKLTFNDEKTEFMLIGSRSHLASIDNRPILKLGYRHIRHVRYKKSLGMVLDEQLKWDKHNEVQCKKISNSIALLKRARPFVPRHTLIKMYNAIVLPHFNYCSTIWNDGSCSVINKLSKLQRRAARIITSSTYDIRSSQILKDLNWKPIEVDLKNRETVMTFKALTGLGPDYLEQLFNECNNDIYSLRSNNTKLALPKPRTNFLKRSFSYRAAKSWNELPNEITGDFRELSVSAFKRRLEKNN